MLDLLKRKSVIPVLLVEGLLIYLWVRTGNPLFILGLVTIPVVPLFAYRILELDANLLLPLIVVLGIVTPPFRFGTVLPWMRIEEFVIFFVGAALFLALIDRPELVREVPRSARITLILAFLFAVTITVSLYHAIAFLNYSVSYKDLFEYVKILKLGILVVFGAVFFRFSERSLERVTKVLIYGGVFLTLVAVYQVATRFTGGRLYMRPESLIGNANYLGIFMSFVSSFAIAYYLYRAPTVRNAIVAAVCISGAVLSLSRTGFVSVIAVVLYHLIAGRKSRVFRERGRRRFQFLLLTLGIGVGAFLFLVFGTFMGRRLVETFAPMQAVSFQLRLLVWMYHLQIFFKSPLFGWGPSSLTLTSITDNEYILMARNFGVFGLLAFLLLMFSFYWIARRITRRPGVDTASLAFAKGTQGAVVCFLLASITATSYSHHQIMSVFWALFGALLAVERTLERKRIAEPISL